MDRPSIVVGIFDDRYQAELAYDRLKQAGFAADDVGFAIRGVDAVEGGMITDALGTKDGSGAAMGAAAGAAAGGLLGAIAALVIPGVGPVVAAGLLTTALGFAGAGAAVGGILGAMTGLGVSQEEALYYQEQFNAGKALVTVRVSSDYELDAAVTLIRRFGGRLRMRDMGAPDDVAPGGALGTA